ncbi:MAG: translation initiation factor IF-3 [Omnitrophica WOR_2 bacterium SM23_29]|nr:MAG: translation initiation factor IF-3 [Omnitrophica WOR_2 bacterium SM23_29]
MNERIRAPQVRVIGPEGNQLGVLPIQKALELTNQYELDLVEVAPQVEPPVCRIMDFSKFKYDQEKKEREARKHQMRIHLKEVRMKPNIDEHDYQVKLRQAINFLNKKDKVKVSLFFRGRQMEHMDLGRRVLDRFINDTQQAGRIEREPALEGRIISVVLAPR